MNYFCFKKNEKENINRAFDALYNKEKVSIDVLFPKESCGWSRYWFWKEEVWYLEFGNMDGFTE